MGEQTFRVVLVNMPFASLSLPSLALTQLASVLRARFGARVAVETLYLNLDFARFFGDTRYYSHVVADAGFLTGVGDWFFRQCAFPAAEDNTGAYLRRFYFGDDAETRTLRGILVEKRKAAAAFLDTLIAAHGLAQADVVGFTTMFSQTVASIAMARRLKAMNPGLVTAVGGSACHGVMGHELARQVEPIDYVFSGSGLVSFPAFVQRCMAGGAAVLPGCRPVRCAAFRGSDGGRAGHRRRGPARLCAVSGHVRPGLSRPRGQARPALRDLARVFLGREDGLRLLRPERAAPALPLHDAGQRAGQHPLAFQVGAPLPVVHRGRHGRAARVPERGVSRAGRAG
jgi:hypothetical protein